MEVLIQDKPHDVKPDVGIWRDRPFGSAIEAPVAVLPPPPILETIAQELPVKLWTVEIREAELGILVTSIEILSPVNKRPSHEAFAAHQRNRTDLMRAGVNLLEIDLLRSGRRWEIPGKKLPAAPYFLFLWRVFQPTTLGIWPVQLHERIPLLPVPLREPDPDVTLDLKLAIDMIYERASYDIRIDYRKLPPKPEFSAHEQAWIDGIVTALE